MAAWIMVWDADTWTQFMATNRRCGAVKQNTTATLKRVRSGDRFLCYVAGWKTWAGVLRFVGRSATPCSIYRRPEFEVPYIVEPVAVLPRERAVGRERMQAEVEPYRPWLQRELQAIRDEAAGRRIENAILAARR